MLDQRLEPVATTEHPTVPSARPVSDLEGKRVAFVDNSKVNTDLLSRVSQRLVERFGIVAGPMIRKAATKDRLTETQINCTTGKGCGTFSGRVLSTVWAMVAVGVFVIWNRFKV